MRQALLQRLKSAGSAFGGWSPSGSWRRWPPPGCYCITPPGAAGGGARSGRGGPFSPFVHPAPSRPAGRHGPGGICVSLASDKDDSAGSVRTIGGTAGGDAGVCVCGGRGAVADVPGRGDAGKRRWTAIVAGVCGIPPLLAYYAAELLRLPAEWIALLSPPGMIGSDVSARIYLIAAGLILAAGFLREAWTGRKAPS